MGKKGKEKKKKKSEQIEKTNRKYLVESTLRDILQKVLRINLPVGYTHLELLSGSVCTMVLSKCTNYGCGQLRQ